jgi:hypothetical protein
MSGDCSFYEGRTQGIEKEGKAKKLKHIGYGLE